MLFLYFYKQFTVYKCNLSLYIFIIISLMYSLFDIDFFNINVWFAISIRFNLPTIYNWNLIQFRLNRDKRQHWILFDQYIVRYAAFIWHSSLCCFYLSLLVPLWFFVIIKIHVENLFFTLATRLNFYVTKKLRLPSNTCDFNIGRIVPQIHDWTCYYMHYKVGQGA